MNTSPPSPNGNEAVTEEIKYMAWLMREELKRRRLIVELIPSRLPEISANGGKIRTVVERNPRWYRDFCADYPKRRSRLRRRKKPDTKIRRELTLNGLRELEQGRSTTVYANRLLPAVQQEIERWRRIIHPNNESGRPSAVGRPNKDESDETK